jgi:hypothetical protein
MPKTECADPGIVQRLLCVPNMAINHKDYIQGGFSTAAQSASQGRCCNQRNAESFGGNSELAEHAKRMDFPFR